MLTDNDLMEWDQNISRLIRLSDYQKIKKLKESVDKQLERLNSMDEIKIIRNPRQEAIKYHNSVKKVALQKQSVRLGKKLTLLEENIKKDMETLK